MDNAQRIQDLRRLGMNPTADAYEALVDTNERNTLAGIEIAEQRDTYKAELDECRRLLAEQAEEMAEVRGINYMLAIDAQRSVDQARAETEKVLEELAQERRNREEGAAYFIPHDERLGGPNLIDTLTDDELIALTAPRDLEIPPPEDFGFVRAPAKGFSLDPELTAITIKAFERAEKAFIECRAIARQTVLDPIDALSDRHRAAYLAPVPAELLPTPGLEILDGELCDRCGGGGIDPEPFPKCCGRVGAWGECDGSQCVGAEPVPDRCQDCGGSGIQSTTEEVTTQ